MRPLKQMAATILFCATILLSGVSAQSTDQSSLMAYVKSAPGAWYTGTLCKISEQSLCLSDVNHWFAPEVIFVSKYGDKVSRAYFSKGKKVKMLLNENHRCAILMEL